MADAYQEDQVTIAYDTMWEGTTKIAHKIAEEVVLAGISMIRKRVIWTAALLRELHLKICRMTGAARYAV